MQWEEFMELQQCLIAWYNVFQQHDTNRSGFIDAAELTVVIRQLFGEYLSLVSICFHRHSGIQQHENCLYLS